MFINVFLPGKLTLQPTNGLLFRAGQMQVICVIRTESDMIFRLLL